MRVDASIGGLQAAQDRLASRADRIARLEVPVAPGQAPVDLADELTGTLLDVRLGQANVDVIRAQDTLARETLDLLG